MLALLAGKVRRSTAGTVVERAALTKEQAAPLARLTTDDGCPSPQHWTPVRPGLRADAAQRLEPSDGPGLRAPLCSLAAAHVPEHAGH